MAKSVSIVDARRRLGKLADEVQRTGTPVVLTRRGEPVARIVADAEPGSAKRRRKYDALGPLRGTVTINCTDAELLEAIRELRQELADSLEGAGDYL